MHASFAPALLALLAALPAPAPRSTPAGRTATSDTRSGAAATRPDLARHVGVPGRLTHIDTRDVWTSAAPVVLDGPVVVDAGGALIIEAGTRIEGKVGSYVIVSRDGTIEARGTVQEPIVLTCTATSKYPGCWGGVIVHGYARVNSGTPTSPASPARSPSGDCNEEADPIASPLRFGGCNDADDSGLLRYMRIEYAERGLHLAGVGSGTVVHDVQANRTRGDGVVITGGDVNVRDLFLTANGTGMRWTGGWRGDAQSIAVQQDILRFAAGIVGQNGTTTSGAAADAQPRSAPSLYNITIIAQSVPANPNHGSARALVLERGTAGTIRNLFLYAPQIALDIAGTSTCSQLVGNTLTLRNVLTAGATTLGEGSIPASCNTTEAALLGSSADANSVLPGVSGLLVSENDLYLPDLRPVAGSALATAVAATPPSGGFFVSGQFVGAIPPIVQGARTAIPWFSGWTSPAPPPAPIPQGVIRGVVRSPFRGLIAGARVTDDASGETAVSTSTGTYVLTLPAGTALLDVTLLPSGCPVPPTRSGVVQPNDTTTLDLIVDCPPLPGTERVSAGDGFACAIADQGTHCWGENGFGQLGNGSTSPSLLPAPVATGFTSLSAGARHACGREPNGIVRCWGDGSDGQIGDGAQINRSLPTAGPGGPYQLVTTGGAHTCALAIDGAAFCWGANADGQLGNGTTTRALSPVAVGGGRTFATLAAGRNHTCGLDLTGAAWCWGSNAQGQLGDGTTTNRVTPVAVLGNQLFAALAGGGDTHTCATGATGTVRCWGANAGGQLGNNSTAPSSVPVVVQSSVALSQLTLGDQHSCAITPASVSVCWGTGGDGQIGDAFTVSRLIPTAAQASARFNKLTGGAGYTCGVTFGAVTGEDNVIVISLRSLLCWGKNSSGQFGRGSTISATTPTAAATGLTIP
jgi:alpha-tubulin suppressor-like RCC1 family protein